ncbi:hypothetical protein DCO48_08115 [Pseudomonas sp. SDI]|nr:hypothetical protein DCO48_08115 [Pseudomonas sp. SDI]
MQRSVLATTAPDSARAYTAFGDSRAHPTTSVIVGFNGERIDPFTGHYQLGNGNREYSPGLMRFHRPDPRSPFDLGGLNAYAYCLGDPINRSDPSGNFSLFRALAKLLSKKPKPIEKMRTLKNLRPEYHLAEVAQTQQYYKSGHIAFRKIQDNASLHEILNNPSLNAHKWIMTRRRELVVGSYAASMIEPTHASIAAVASQVLGSSKQVVGAGRLMKRNGDVILNNWTGHYEMPASGMKSIKQHIQSLNIDIRTKKVYPQPGDEEPNYL